jgi:hypothetical protein
MPPAKVFSVPKVQGEILYASEVNALDDAQADRIARSGTSALTAAATVDLGAFDLIISGSGVGRFEPDADVTNFGGTGFPGIPGRTLTDVVPPVMPVYDKTTTPIAFQESIERVQQVDTTGSPALNFWVSLPVGCTITSLKVGLKKAAGGSLPAVFPTVGLYRQDLATDTLAIVGSTVADAPANIAAYKLYHRVEVTFGAGHTVAAGYGYLVTVTGDDNSTSAATGVFIYRPSVTLAISTLRQI